MTGEIETKLRELAVLLAQDAEGEGGVASVLVLAQWRESVAGYMTGMDEGGGVNLALRWCLGVARARAAAGDEAADRLVTALEAVSGDAANPGTLGTH